MAISKEALHHIIDTIDDPQKLEWLYEAVKEIVDDDQSWFWSERWQAGEREAEASASSLVFESADDLLRHIRDKYALQAEEDSDATTM